MPTGTIKSYSTQKSFGFIESENGESVFFHISKVAPNDKNNIKAGCIVSFDECPTPKGMAAEKIVIAGKAAERYVAPQSNEVIVSKTEACGKDNRVVHKLPRITVEDRNPEAAVARLKIKAGNAGCNAIVNLSKGRRRGQAWTNSNYRFSVHAVSAQPALVKRIVHTTDLTQANQSKQQLETDIQKVASAKVENAKVHDASRYNLVIGAVIIAIILAFAIPALKQQAENKAMINEVINNIRSSDENTRSSSITWDENLGIIVNEQTINKNRNPDNEK
ncbi:cold-shock protein [Halomonas sp. LS-001]